MTYTLRASLAAIAFTASACGGLEPPDGPPVVTIDTDPAGGPGDLRLPPPESGAQALVHLIYAQTQNQTQTQTRAPPPSLVEKQGSSPEPVHDYKLEGSKNTGPNPFKP